MEKELFDEELEVINSKIKDIERGLRLLKDEKKRKERARALYFGERQKKIKKEKTERVELGLQQL